MESFSALLIFIARNSQVTGEFPAQRSFYFFFDLRLNKWLSKHSLGWIDSWVSNREAGDLRRHRAHYDVTVINQR